MATRQHDKLDAGALFYTLAEDLKTIPEKYTAWFQIAFPKIKKWWSSNFNYTIA